MNDKIREHIYLAALLHDIGKFYQRADTGSVKSSKFLKQGDKDLLESVFCPLRNGYYTHKHVLWTAQFIEDYASVFEKLVAANLSDLRNEDNLINLAARHHLNDNELSYLGKIIKKADCLSSGMDRESDTAFRDAQDEEEKSWDAFKKKRMVSVLETISLSQQEIQNKKNWEHIPIRKLCLHEDTFPKPSFDADPDYSQLWNEFIHDFKFIQADTYRAFAETLLSLLQKYTSCIPSSTINFADVSLYDHLKTTAALAVCLYDYQQSEVKGKTPFLLIGGDFSGIQSYIYQIVSKYAGKNLKGRSFYLRLLSDTIVRYILRKLSLYQANIIYNSGGSFYILAPNTNTVIEKLKSAISTIEANLFKCHGASLFVAVDYVELSEEALMLDNRNVGIADVWTELFVKRDCKKKSRFAAYIKDNYSSFFNPVMSGGDTARDVITGEEFLPDEKPEMIGELAPLKAITAKQILIGSKLKETDFIVLKEGDKLSYWSDKESISPLDLDLTYYFLSKSDIEAKKELLKASADNVTVITLNGKNGNCDFMPSTDVVVNGINNIYSLEFYGGNEFNDNTFEEMCDNHDNDAFSKLGVFRMDVDNLGNIFRNGIQPERATLSRYAALSRSFDFFFSGYLNTIWRNVDKEKAFIVYSGGDDLFIVGDWKTTIVLAEKIKDKFAEFTCNNKAFSLSGGIAILSPKYPIMKGADESDAEERNAKGHTVNDRHKNSISFMDFPMNWNLEYPAVKKLKDLLLEYLNDDKLPKSFISKISAHYLNAKVKNHKITEPKTYWMLTYDLSRFKGRNRQTEVNLLIDNCINEICGNKYHLLNAGNINTEYHPIELWAFAARWAELEYRANRNNN